MSDQAAGAPPNPILKDLANLRAALALTDSAPYAQLQPFANLIGDKASFDSSGPGVLLVRSLLKAGRYGRSQQVDFNALTITLGVSQSMRDRAQSAMALIDSGQIDAALAAAKAAATLPPPKPGTFSGQAQVTSGAETPSLTSAGFARPAPGR